MVLTAVPPRACFFKIQGNVPDILRVLDSESNILNNLAVKAYVSLSYIGGRCSIRWSGRVSINFIHRIHASQDRYVLVEGMGGATGQL